MNPLKRPILKMPRPTTPLSQLREDLGVPRGVALPQAVIERASHVSGSTGEIARLLRSQKRGRS